MRSLAVLGVAVLASSFAVRAQEPWPAEPLAQSLNLTGVEGPEPNDFHTDLSGLSWNPVTRRLWVCRNGPGGDQSKFWALVEDGAGGFRVDERAGRRAEWTGFGDLESLTQADLASDVVYLLVEGQERIQAYDVSVYGTATLLHDWNLLPYLPLNGGSGAEGLTFVPDAALAAGGFVDGAGNPRLSAGGLGGLMLVGHQNGGAVYAFDLRTADDGVVLVGEYRTSSFETAALEFDRSTGALYVWHDDTDRLEKAALSSTAVSGQSYRRLNALRVWAGPEANNNEGIAMLGSGDCLQGGRTLFLAVDGGGASSLRAYRRFSDGCPAAPGEPSPPANLRRADVR